jgi:hypothetical protein
VTEASFGWGKNRPLNSASPLNIKINQQLLNAADEIIE